MIFFESKKQFYPARIIGKIDRITLLKSDNNLEAGRKAKLHFRKQCGFVVLRVMES